MGASSAVARKGQHDIEVRGCTAWFLPLATRIPLKFGPETLTTVTCLRIRLDVQDRGGRTASGWGETPLSVQWVWPCALPYEERHRSLKEFSLRIAAAWVRYGRRGHPIEVGHGFIHRVLPALLREHNRLRRTGEPMPWLAALVCCSAFDLALHDAFGMLLGLPVYETYTPQYMNRDLSHYLVPERAGGGDDHRDPDHRERGASPEAVVERGVLGTGHDPADRQQEGRARHPRGERDHEGSPPPERDEVGDREHEDEGRRDACDTHRERPIARERPLPVLPLEGSIGELAGEAGVEWTRVADHLESLR